MHNYYYYVFALSFELQKNRVITSKYNIITFLPRNLFEQFLRVANIYFLFLLIIQLIPGVASVPFYSTLIPLVGVLLITAVKDAYDDIVSVCGCVCVCVCVCVYVCGGGGGGGGCVFVMQ